MPPNSLRDYSIEISPVGSLRVALTVDMEAAAKGIDHHDENICKTPAISSKDIAVGSLLGSGAFADVFEVVSVATSSLEAIRSSATQLGDSALESRNVSQRLVVKKLKPSQDASPDKLKRDIMNEVQILCGIRHENVISLCAFSVDHDFILLERVVEDLDVWLRRQRNNQQQTSSNRSQHPPLAWNLRSVFASRQLVNLAAEQEQQDRIRGIVLGLAKGIEHLHCEQGVLHRDIKPANIGIDARGVVKLMDFGSARRIGAPVNDGTQQPTAPLPHALVGSYVYLAPEVYQPGRTYSYPADVYSFAIVAWETCTLMAPYPELKYVSQIQRIVLESGMRPPLRAIASKPMRKLLQKCWHADPDKAPSMQVVVETLEHIAPTCHDDVPSRD